MNKAILIISFLLISTSLAQDISQLRIVGRAETMSGELIDKSMRDANGAICSGLIIVSDLSGLTFQSSNGIVKINSKPGNDFLFLSPDERVVTVYCTGYKPLQIILNEIGVKLQSGEVWKVELTGDKKIEAIPVNILINQDVEIFIDGISKGKGKEQTINLSAGSHQIQVVREGYQTIEGIIEVSTTKNLFKYEMTSIDPAVVSINSNPTGAKIFIEETEKGETNKQLFLYPGTYNLRLQKSGFLNISEQIIVTETGDNTHRFNLKKNAAYLVLQLEPTDAEVYINKEKITQLNRIELAPGTYKIEVTKQHYYPKEEVVTLSIGDSISRQFKLVPKVGSLQFSVQPSEAKVILARGGIQIESWQGLKLKKDLLEGVYQIKVSAEGYKSLTQDVEIKENQILEVDIPMEKGSDIFHCGTSITYDNKKYNTVKIGNQCWLKENLDIGTMIKGSQNANNNGLIEKYCYDDNSANCTNYGGLYQWDEAMQYVMTEGAQGICPEGWHIPTFTEFQTLNTTVGGDGNSLKAIIQGTGNGAGTNKSKFSALLAGYGSNSGYFNNIGKNANFWSSTKYDVYNAKRLFLYYDDSDIYLDYNVNEDCYSVRCVKDVEIKKNQSSVIDIKKGKSSDCPISIKYEGKTYYTVQIGDQCWLKENLDVGKMISGIETQKNNKSIEKYCYDDDPSNCTTYGGLYQWNEAMQYVTNEGAQGICPEGWHIPTEEEFQTLSSVVGGNTNALKEIGQGTGEGVGTNKSGFSALLAGTRNGPAFFSGLGSATTFWISTENPTVYPYYFGLKKDKTIIDFTIPDKDYGFSVRCVQDVEIKENQDSGIDLSMGKATDCPNKITYEGKSYNTVLIGDQCWLKENLDVGAMINSSTEADSMKNNGILEKYCYDNDTENCTTYGGLYQWDEAMQYVITQGAKGICPPGWHIPTLAEFQTLSTQVGGDGNALKREDQGSGGGQGTNTSGFSALLAGGRSSSGGFGNLGSGTLIWSSSEDDAVSAYPLDFYDDYSFITQFIGYKDYGFGVRCLKD